MTHGNTLVWVDYKHPLDQVPRVHGDIVWHIVKSLADLVEQLGHVFVIERESPHQKGVEDNAARPDIRCGSVIRQSLRAKKMLLSAARACVIRLMPTLTISGLA